ncbi:MAG: hypothetical protein NT020_01255 [Chloroflexales bacterium]|nr:hypothetical protein [Chloroflexales bacterium]
MDLIFAYFIYPGLIPSGVFALAFGFIVTHRRPMLPPDIRKAILSVDGFAAFLSILLAIGAATYMPWPFNGAYTSIAGPLLMWAAIEASFLIPSLAAQTSSSPLVVRGAARSLQIGLAGRVVVWCVFGVLYWANQTWQIATLPAIILAWVAAILALPAAIGVGMFRNATALTGLMTTGLSLSTTALMQITTDMRAAVLILTVTTSLCPFDMDSNWLRLIFIAGTTIITMVGLRFLVRNQPFATLAAALRWCWWRALPPALLALIYLIVKPY